MTQMHPGMLLFALAAVVALTRGIARQIVLLVGVGYTAYSAWHLGVDAVWQFALPEYTLTLLHVDTLSHIFGLILSLVTAIGSLYALHISHGGEHVAALSYAGAALGVVFAGDLITLFVFWELMAITSLFVIWHGDTPHTQAAGLRYLLVHILGGSILLCGILLHLTAGGDLAIHALTSSTTNRAAFWFILVGVSINTAIPPLHAWLTDAYPEASVSGSVFLSALTTKTAVYVLIRLFPGAPILLWAGVMMTLYGVGYAMLTNNPRRLLAYHIVSQVGYMVAAVGMGSALALNGAVAHAFCHILYKALLFMAAGAVIYATGKHKLTELGGIAAAMPLVVVLYMVGAVSISGLPLFNGFISKSMIITAAAQGHHPVAELLLTLASIGTFLSVGLKLPYFMFFGRGQGIQPGPIRLNMYVAMGAAAICCIALGIYPDWLYVRLPFDATYHPYTVDHIVSAVQLLLGTALAFWWLLPKLSGEDAINLDTDWLYRKPVARAMHALITSARRVGGDLEATRLNGLRRLMPYVHHPSWLVLWAGLVSRPTSTVQESLPAFNNNVLRQPIGSTILWIVICFALAVLYLWLP